MIDYPIPVTWDRSGLEQVGFVGFVPIVGLDRASLPPNRGIYAVVRESVKEPVFLAQNPISKKKIYTAETLLRKWIPGGTIIYIGKADPVDGIRGRLGAFAKKSSSHSGGRAIWQLQDAHELAAAWLETPDYAAGEVETHYLQRFKEHYGRYPYANWRR